MRFCNRSATIFAILVAQLLSAQSGSYSNPAPAPPTPAVGALWDVRSLGLLGDGSTDNTAKFNAAVQAACAAHGKALFFPAGEWRFASRPAPIGCGLWIEGEGNGSNPRNGTALIADYNEVEVARGFLSWDGSYAHNVGTGGGISNLSIYKGGERNGGTALKLTGVDDNHRAGFFTISDVVVSGAGNQPGTWNKDLVIDGSCCTTLSAQGIRDIHIRNFWASMAKGPGDAVQISNGVQLFWYGGEVFGAGARAPVGITIEGSGSTTGNSTNIWLFGLYLTGDLNVANAKNVYCSMCQVGGDLNMLNGKHGVLNDTVHFYGWIGHNFNAESIAGTNLFAGGEITGNVNDPQQHVTKTFPEKKPKK